MDPARIGGWIIGGILLHGGIMTILFSFDPIHFGEIDFWGNVHPDLFMIGVILALLGLISLITASLVHRAPHKRKSE